MYLACDFEILKIFGLDIGSTKLGTGEIDMKSEAFEVLHAAYLSMARAGIAALEFWDPKSRKWGQAHMQARFSILQCFLDAKSDGDKTFCDLDVKPDKSSVLEDLVVRIDPHQILTTGRKAVGVYLQKLHVYKSTADLQAGKELYDHMTNVDEWWATKVRPFVLKKKVPRKVFVMANTVEVGEGAGGVTEGEGEKKVLLKEYEATREGMIQSWVERDV